MTGLPPSPPPTLTPPRSWGRIALILSLVLSLTGNALALGAWVRFREVRSDLLGPEAANARLPDDLRQELRAALKADMRGSLVKLRAVVRARAAIVAAARAEPFDRAAAEAAMLDFRRAVDDLLAEVQVVFLDRLDEIAER